MYCLSFNIPIERLSNDVFNLDPDSDIAIFGTDFKTLREIYTACLQSDMPTIEKKMGELSGDCRNLINGRMSNIIDSNESRYLQSAIADFAYLYFKMKDPNSIVAAENTLELLEIDRILFEKGMYVEKLENTQKVINKLENEINTLLDEKSIGERRSQIRECKKEIKKISRSLVRVRIEELLVSPEYEIEKNKINTKKEEIMSLEKQESKARKKFAAAVQEDTGNNALEILSRAEKNCKAAQRELSRLEDLLLAKDGRYEIELKRIHELEDTVTGLTKQLSKERRLRGKCAKGTIERETVRHQIELTETKIDELGCEIIRIRERIEAIKSGYYIKPAVKSGNNNNNQ